MRLHLAVALLATLPVAGAAGPLTSGQLEVSVLGGSPLVFVGDGTSAGSALSGAQVVLSPGSAFADMRTLFVSAPPLTGIFFTVGANQGGTFSGVPLTGPDVTLAGRYQLTGLGGVTLLDIAIPIGGTGSQQLTFTGVTWMAEHYPWTSGSLLVTGLGSASTTAATTGSVQTGTPGLVSLVAATKLSSNLADPSVASFRLTLHFESVPEPAAWLLLTAGALALAGARQASTRR